MEVSEIEKLVSNLLSFLTIDNLFSRLTHTEKVTEFSILLDRTDCTTWQKLRRSLGLVVGAALRVLLLLLVIYSILVIPADRILGIPQTK